MEVIFVLVPIALFVVGVMILAFWWAARSGQFDDLEGPAHRILMDQERRIEPESDDEPPRQDDAP
jgi:cbb3-type cytochrome oxidase maturation protein